MHLGAPCEPILPITRKPRQIGDQRIAGTRHGIEKSRFTYIRSTDQCDYRQHVAYGFGGGVAGSAGGVAGSAAGAAGTAGAGVTVAGAAAAATLTFGVAR
jgi:hypothetical protein